MKESADRNEIPSSPDGAEQRPDTLSGEPKNLVVVLPTLDRPGTLRWTLSTILRQTGCAKWKPRVVIANNGGDPEGVAWAASEAMRISKPSAWQLEMVHRRTTGDPARWWYETILSSSEDDDVVLLIGDDDLFLPGAIARRVAAISSVEADVLLGMSASDLVFVGNRAERMMVPTIHPPAGTVNGGTRQLLGDVIRYTPAFIGNHVYRIGRSFRDELAEAFSILSELPLPSPQQLAMVPYVLPLIAGMRGRLGLLGEVGTIRGQVIDEVSIAPFGVRTWWFGVLGEAILGILEREPFRDIEELDTWRADVRSMSDDWLLPTLCRTETRLALRGVKRRRALTGHSLAGVLRGGRRVVGEALGLRGRRSRLRVAEEALPTETWIKTIWPTLEARERQ